MKSKKISKTNKLLQKVLGEQKALIEISKPLNNNSELVALWKKLERDTNKFVKSFNKIYSSTSEDKAKSEVKKQNAYAKKAAAIKVWFQSHKELTTKHSNYFDSILTILMHAPHYDAAYTVFKLDEFAKLIETEYVLKEDITKTDDDSDSEDNSMEITIPELDIIDLDYSTKEPETSSIEKPEKYSTLECAKLVGCSRSHVQMLIKTGELEAMDRPEGTRKLWVSADEIHRFIESRKEEIKKRKENHEEIK